MSEFFYFAYQLIPLKIIIVTIFYDIKKLTKLKYFYFKNLVGSNNVHKYFKVLTIVNIRKLQDLYFILTLKIVKLVEFEKLILRLIM